MNIKKHSTLFLLLSAICFTGTLLAQSKTGQFYVTNPYPTYKLSPDGKTLCVYETNDSRDKWAMFFNLDNYSWQSIGSMSLNHPNVSLSPDFKTVYGNYDSFNGYKGNSDWIPFKKYMSWYFPNSRNALQKMQWADKFFIITQMQDGNLLAATGLKFKKSKGLVYPAITTNAFNIVDPATGKILKTLSTFPKEKEFRIPDDWRKPSSFLIDNDRLLLWTLDNRYFLSIKPTEGEIRRFTFPLSISSFAGKYGMGYVYSDESKIGNNIIRKVIVDMETGQTVHERKIALKDALSYWTTASGKYFYTLNGHTSMLCKEEWNGSNLVVLDSVKLDINGLFENGKWGDRSSYNYLIVSESTNKVLLLPSIWKKQNQQQEALLSWTLKDGRQDLVNPNFIRPSANYLAKQNRPDRPDNLPLNALVKNHNGYYVLLGKNELTKKWAVIKFVKDRNGNYERVKKEEDLWEFTPVGTDIISSTPCSICNGSGMMATVNRVTSQHTDKMIYNQITTTTTKDVVGQKTCNQCRGLGFTGVY